MLPKKTTRKPGERRLKNYRSQASDGSIFEAIRTSLASHKARRIMFDNDDDGRAIALSFTILANGQKLEFRLPARLENVAALVQQSYKNMGKSISGDTLDDQTYRTAWANIRDWVAAQMALIDSGMVRTEEVFLPYLLVDKDKTLFEDFTEQRALPSPRIIIEEEK